jgi:fluoride ion exporter CrcB/FEX
MNKILIDVFSVMSGAALGALLRYLVVITLPAPILIVNLVGSLIIGFIYPKLSQSFPQYITLINTGIIGGLTSFSFLVLK